MGYHQTPLGSVICLIQTPYCPPLATLLFSYLCCFPSPCARTICTLFGRNRRRAHGPCSKHIYCGPCTLPSPHLDLLSYGLGKPLFVLFTYANNNLVLRARFRASDFVSALCALPPPTSTSPPLSLSPSIASSLVSATLGRDLQNRPYRIPWQLRLRL